MSSKKPNLEALTASLRQARAERGGRNGSHVRPSGHAERPPEINRDLIVQQTDDDAAGSRLSAVELGYLSDSFARAFAKSSDVVVRRQPIINRGTYVRTTAIDRLIDSFLGRREGEQTCQIISLGAGTDTRFFRLAQKRRHRRLKPNFVYHELDFPTTTANKIAAVRRSSSIRNLLRELSSKSDGDDNDDDGNEGYTTNAAGTSLTSPYYHVHGLDIRMLANFGNPAIPLDPTTPPPTTQQLPHLNTSAPTLILSEMCLSYLPSATSTSILRTLLAHLGRAPTVECILYEPLNPTDAFGRTMISNLASRGIELPGLLECPTLDAHAKRLRELGFTVDGGGGRIGVSSASADGCGGGGEGGACSIKHIWDHWIDVEEKERLRGLEMVDEEEEWHLLAGHYGIIWGVREGSSREVDGMT